MIIFLLTEEKFFQIEGPSIVASYYIYYSIDQVPAKSFNLYPSTTIGIESFAEFK
jgi:hypothetical protein